MHFTQTKKAQLIYNISDERRPEVVHSQSAVNTNSLAIVQ